MSDKKRKKQNEIIEGSAEAKKEINWTRELLEWLATIVVAIGIALIINNIFVVNAIIPTGSMETTIMTGDRVFGNRLAYKNSSPVRGDIVIFKYPDDESQLFIKRVIGLPGDTVEIYDGLVYINGSDTPLSEPYINQSEEPVGDFGPYEVPSGHYFLMGDNRNHSMDARYWANTYVAEDKILGKAFVRYWPHPMRIQ